MEINDKDLLLDRCRRILESEAAAIKSIPLTDGYAKAVELIVEKVNRKGGKLVTSGMGKAGQIAMNIATTFCSTGTPAVFLHPSEAQHGDLGILQRNDVLLLLSNSGKTREILELIDLTKALYPEIPLSSSPEAMKALLPPPPTSPFSQDPPRRYAHSE